MKIQLALQGGGAKLCGLLAVMEAVQQLEAAGQITVTRLAGTSAGAIAAAFYAAGVDFKALRKDIRRNRDLLAPMVPRPTKWSLVKVLRGQPIVDIEPVRLALGRVMEEQGVRRFADLKIPLSVLATDLTNGSAHVHHDPESNVVNAVLDSCALPFYFRGPAKKDAAALLVDGGICENFPVDVLQSFAEESGPVIGVSFQSSAVRSNPTSPLAMLAALIDTSIENSVRRAQRQVGIERLLLLRGDIGTLEFERALDEGMGDRYDLTVRDALDFFRQVTSRLEKAAEQPRSVPSVLVEGEGQVDSVTTLQRHADLYQAQHAHVRMKYLEARMLVRAEGLLGPTVPAGDGALRRPDLLGYRLRFQAAQDSIQCIRLAVLEEQAVEFHQTLRTEVVDQRYKLRPTIDLRAWDRKAPDRRAYLLFLNPPIRPGDPDGPFTLDYTHQITGLLHQLEESGVDTLTFTTKRAAGPTPRISIVVVLPASRPGYQMRESSDTTSTDKGRAMTSEELRQVRQELSLGPEHYPVGWVGSDIEAGIDFSTEIFAPGR